MKGIWILIFSIVSLIGDAQIPAGFINSSSHSGSQPFAVGDIFLGSQSGGLSVLVLSTFLVRVEEISEDNNYIIFPNPASHAVNIYSVDGSSIENVRVFDLKGIEIPVVFDHGTLELNAMERGVYILWIEKKLPLKLIIE